MHRIPIEDIIYSWLYYVDLRSRKIKLITEEKVTHYTWINNNKFLIYQRLLPKFIKSKRIKKYNTEINGISKSKVNKSSRRNKIKFLNSLKYFLKNILGRISSGFVIYEVKNQKIQKRLISFNLLGIDCHPFYSVNHNKIYLDSYPNKNKDVEIYSIDLKKSLFAKKEKILKGEWKTNLGKLDAHLRVSQNGNIFVLMILKKFAH